MLDDVDDHAHILIRWTSILANLRRLDSDRSVHIDKGTVADDVSIEESSRK